MIVGAVAEGERNDGDEEYSDKTANSGSAYCRAAEGDEMAG